MGRWLVFLRLIMNLLGWNLPTGNENVKGVGGGPGRDCCQNCPALQLQAWGPPAAPCSLGTDQGPLCRASTCSTTRGSCHPSSFGSARTIGTPLGVLLCVPSRGLQGCSHHALLPLLTHRSQGCTCRGSLPPAPQETPWSLLPAPSRTSVFHVLGWKLHEGWGFTCSVQG